MAWERQTFALLWGYLLDLYRRACSWGFLAWIGRVWEQGSALAQTSSLCCVNKSFSEVQPAGIAQRFAQARRKVS